MGLDHFLIDGISMDDDYVSKTEYFTRNSWNEDRFRSINDQIAVVNARISEVKSNIQRILIDADKITSLHREVYGDGDACGIKSTLNFLSRNEERRSRVQTLLFTGFILNALVIAFNLFLHFFHRT